MRLLVCLWLVFFWALQLSAQSKKEFKSFLKLFPETRLPVVCYEYGDSALIWDEEYGIEIGLKDADSTLQLPDNLVQKYLLRVDESRFVDLATDSSAYTFYALHRISKNAGYYTITFERRFSESWNPTSSEKFLVTLDKNGKLISKAEIASFKYGGTFLYDDSEKEKERQSHETDSIIPEENEDSDGETFLRLPYFPRTAGCISGNSVHLKSDQLPLETHYQIDKKGNIVKIK